MRAVTMPSHPAVCALALLLLLASGAEAATSGDWPAVGNDQGHSGYAPALLLPSGAPAALWSRAVELQVGDSPWPLVVGGGTIFTTLAGGQRAALLALDAATGAQRWRSDLLFQQPGGDVEPTSLASTPVYANGRVYCCVLQQWSWSYQVLCLDAATGATLWRSAELYPNGRGWPAAPVVTADGVYLNLGWDGGVASLFRVAIADGALLAELYTATESITPPAMAGGRLVTWYDANQGGLPGQSGYGLAVIDPLTLVVRGFTRISESLGYLEAQMVVGDDLAFVGDSETSTVTAVDLATHTRLWSYAAEPSSRMAYAAGVLYVSTPQAILAIAARTGVLQHTYRPDAAGLEGIASAAIVTPDSVIASGGNTYIWSLGSSLPRTVIPARGHTAALAGTTLVVQNNVVLGAAPALSLSVYRFSTANRPPVASSQTARGLSDEPLRLTMKASDPEQQPLSVRILTAPTKGRLSSASVSMTYTPNADFTGTDTFTYRVSDGTSESATATVILIIDRRGAFIERNGQVVVEAEHPHRRQAGRGVASASAWRTVTDIAGFSGSAAVRALANVGVNTGTTTDGPRLDYDLQFSAPGIYHVWLRLQGESGADDSVLVGLDGCPVHLDPTGLRAPATTWQWSDAGADRRRFTVRVPTPGVHTLNVWMREDGVALDKLLVTASPTVVPTGKGSGESSFLPASNRAPVAVMRSDVIAGRAPLRVTFTSTGSQDPDGGAISVRWLFGDGSAATGTTAARTFTTPGIYCPTVIVTDAVGAISVATTTIVVLPAAGPIVEAAGRVVIEAEDIDRQTVGSSTAANARWLPTRALSGFSGLAALQAAPNSGVNTGGAITGPRLDYHLQIDRPGTYYVWVRLAGATGNDDSLHLGLNGQLATAGGVAPGLLGTWQWSNRVAGASVISVTIPAAGRHVLNLWMREDGVAVDRLILTTDSAYLPANSGPLANPRLPQGSG